MAGLNPTAAHGKLVPAWWITINAGWFSLLVGVVLAILGLYVTWLFDRRNRQRPSIKVTNASTSLVGSVSPQFEGRLKVLFDQIEVSRVNSATVALWNDGNVIFRNYDLVSKDPLRLSVSDGIVLQATVAAASRDVIGAALTVANPSEVEIKFDFLEPRDAISVVIVHSGGQNSLKLNGTLIGLLKGVQQFRPTSYFKTIDRWLNKATMITVLVGFLWLEVWLFIKKGWVMGVLPLGGLVSFALLVWALVWLAERLGKQWSRGVPSVVISNDQLRRRLELDKILQNDP